MIPAAARESLETAGILFAFAVAGTALLAFTFGATRPTIAKTEEAQKLALVEQVLPPGMHDNELMRDTVKLPPAPVLGTAGDTIAYRARLGGRPTGVALEAVAPDGYSGRIRLLIGIRADGQLAGVRVVAHKETPGLGDYVEVTRSDWIRGFEGKSLAGPTEKDWKVKKDGGQFDYMAGATITPRAVVKAVANALRYHEQNRDRLYGAAEGKQ